MYRPKAIFILDPSAHDMIYGPRELNDIARLADVAGAPQTKTSIFDCPDTLKDVEVLFSGWGGPLLDDKFLDLAPRLKAVFYAAGSAAGILTDAVWERGVAVSTSYAANAVPVAEYTLATILFSLKHGWALARRTSRERFYPDRNGAPGCYGSTVGLISLGMIARTLLKLLKPFDLKVIAHDPFVSAAEARELGVERVSLDELFARSDVVSLHSPLLSETKGMIGGSCFAAMKRGATFINTARGAVVREQEMIDVLTMRTDLCAVLDVTQDEPPRQECQLYDLPNVVLTPHMAGSVGAECQRMGRYMVEEFQRYLARKPLKWLLTPELAMRSSHRPVVSVSVAKPARTKRRVASALQR